ncbi:uncharacterized protein LOC115045612 isoform X2 [Echeneis naucrates]|nr:uncharacterized protein LOC115045612 isoform X2 [Echeneis naucrates]
MAQVLVNGDLVGETPTRFKPIADTTLGEPILSYGTTTSVLYVNVTLPMGPNGESIADIISKSKNGPTKATIIYILNITEPKWAATVRTNRNGTFIIQLKQKQTKYCGHVLYKPSTEWGRNESEKAPLCITLQDDHRILVSCLVASAVLLAVLVTTAVVWLCTYVKGGTHINMPKSLTRTSGPLDVILQQSFSLTIISKPKLGNAPCDKTVYTTIQKMPKKTSIRPGGYAPQDIPCPDWQGSAFSSLDTDPHDATSSFQDTSAQSSEAYTAVAVHAPNEVREVAIHEDSGNCAPIFPCRKEPWNKSRPGPNLTLPDPDACESDTTSPLVLHTVRGSNGQLMFSSFTFQLEKSTNDSPSPFILERKPLLSDLTDYTKEEPTLASVQSFDSSAGSDSGCDDNTPGNTPTQAHCSTHYLPSQLIVSDFHQQCQNTPSTDAMFVSGYKQNWMPT